MQTTCTVGEHTCLGRILGFEVIGSPVTVPVSRRVYGKLDATLRTADGGRSVRPSPVPGSDEKGPDSIESEARREPEADDTRRQDAGRTRPGGADLLVLQQHVVGVQHVEHVDRRLRSTTGRRGSGWRSRTSRNLFTVSVRSSPRATRRIVSLACDAVRSVNVKTCVRLSGITGARGVLARRPSDHTGSW